MRPVSTLFAVALLSAGAMLATAEESSAASYSFVGSWDVTDGPDWTCCAPNGPLAYTGQEAAALLFGGSPSDYAISTVDNQVANINFSAWYDQIGVGGGVFAEDYDFKYLGLYYGPTSGFTTPYASAYVADNLFGAGAINYAFTMSTVPIPAAGLLLMGAVGAMGALRARRKIAG